MHFFHVLTDNELKFARRFVLAKEAEATVFQSNLELLEVLALGEHVADVLVELDLLEGDVLLWGTDRGV